MAKIFSVASRVLLCLGIATLFLPDAEAQAPIRPVPMISFGDGQDSVLVAPLDYKIGQSEFIITVPAGFVTDFASTPHSVWANLPPTGRYLLAAVVHDFLYWDQGCTRRQADDLLHAAMAESQVKSSDRDLIWRTVRRVGGSAWEGNSSAKAAGKPRIIPPELMRIPELIAWREYQAQLIAKGIRPRPKPATPPGYCAAAGEVNLQDPVRAGLGTTWLGLIR
jgi:Protein of unknown function (DUF1353)